jgi:hypothetical protein
MPDTQNDRRNQRIIYTALVVLSVMGIAVMDFSEKYGFWYWLVMAVLFGVVSIVLAVIHDRETPGDQGPQVRRQLLHWGTLVVGLLLAFLIPEGSPTAASNQGLVALLLVALASILAGIHFNWRMAVIGLILAATFVAAVLAEEFFWPMLILAFLAVVIIWGYRRRPESA